jgi:hypothetical protein
VNPHDETQTERLDDERLVNLQTLARLTDAHATTVRRWLRESGIQPVVIGRGRTGAIRYRWRDIENWFNSLETVD